MSEAQDVHETDGLLLGLMAISLGSTLLPEELRWVFALSVMITSLGFAVPLSSGLVRARASLRSWAGDAPATPARSIFLDSIRSRARAWAAWWVLYYVALEAVAFVFWGGSNLIFSLPSAALVTCVTAAGLHRLRVAETLPGLAFWSAGAAVTLTFVVGLAVYWVMGTFGLGGYSGVGLIFGPPIYGGLIVTIGAAIYLVRVAREDDAWYRLFR